MKSPNRINWEPGKKRVKGNSVKREPEKPSVQISDEGRSSPDSSTSQVTPRTVVLVILTAVAVLSGLYLLWQVRKVIVWCIIALFVAVALDPAVNWIQRWRTRRITAILLVYLGLSLGMIGTIALVVPLLVTQIKSLANLAFAVSQNPEEWLGRVRDFADRFRLVWLYDAGVSQLHDVPAQLGQSMESFLLSSGGFLVSAVGFITALFSILVISFFLLLEGDVFINLGLQLFPEPQRPRMQRILTQTAGAVSGYVTGNLLISLICGVALYVVLIVLGMPYAIVLALIVAVLDLIPQIGATLGGALLVAAGLFVDPWKSLVLLAYFIIYQLVENNILTPMVYSQTIKLHPLVIFVAVLMGGLLYGIVGTLLAMPVAEVIRILGAEWLAAREHRMG
jgi:predicted PurR-regulated permease PerM